MYDFASFLNSCRTQKGEPHTHTSISPRGSYNIPESKQDLFFSLYHTHTFVQKKECSLIEKHKEISSLLIDLDFKTSKKVSAFHVYTPEFIHDFLVILAKLLKKYIDIPPKAAKFFVFEKDVSKPQKKDGIHIICPFVVSYPNMQFLIREELLFLAEDLIKELPIENTVDDVIDEAVIEKNGWMVYGSHKPESSPYMLKSIFDFHTDAIVYVPDSVYYKNTDKLTRLLSIRSYTMADLTPLQVNGSTILKTWLEERQQKEIQQIKKEKNSGVQLNFSTCDLNTIHDLVHILNVKRAENYTSWIELGWCLHNIDYRLLDVWIQFSQRCERYSNVAEHECVIRWDSMKHQGLGIGSLYMWARHDNPTEYTKCVQNTIEYHICKSVGDKGNEQKSKKMSSNAIYHIVMALKKKYGHNFVCASYNKKVWYEFCGVRWNEDDGDIGLRRRLREELYKDFMHVGIKYHNLAEQKKAMDAKHPNCERYEELSSGICVLAKQLRVANFRKMLSEEASEQLYWDRSRSGAFQSLSFEEILDTRTHLIGMQNGVYDLHMGQFREGRCEDFITLSTQLKWQEYSWTDQEIDDIRSFLEQILPDKATREYVMYTLASFLDGEIAEEHFRVWVGSGGNGKSKLIELFENSFGKYCAKLSISALTQKRASSSAPTPEIARLRGKRFVVLQEPNEHEKLQVGIMKEMTGGDKIVARSLNKEPIEFKPQFKMILTCNQLPKVPADDQGTWRRIRVVKFTSSFKEKPDPENPNEFPLDPHLNEKIKNWANPFFWMLTEYYKLYKKHGLLEPDSVCLSTKEYQMMNDVYGDFVSNYVEKVPKQIITIDSIYVVFVAWYRKVYPDRRCPSRKDLMIYLEKKFGSYINKETRKKGWRGYRVHEFIPEDNECGFESDTSL